MGHESCTMLIRWTPNANTPPWSMVHGKTKGSKTLKKRRIFHPNLDQTKTNPNSGHILPRKTSGLLSRVLFSCFVCLLCLFVDLFTPSRSFCLCVWVCVSVCAMSVFSVGEEGNKGQRGGTFEKRLSMVNTSTDRPWRGHHPFFSFVRGWASQAT